MYAGQKVIDVHGHMTTPAKFRGFAMNLMTIRSPRNRFDMTDEELDRALGPHIDALDTRNIDFQLLSPRPVAMFQWESPHIQRQWASVTNDVLAQSVKLHPDRFGAVGQLPQQAKEDTSAVLDELDRCMKELGHVGVLINPDPSGERDTPGVDDKYWYPLYEKAQEYDAPLLLHPSISKDSRVRSIPHNYQINNVWEEYLATLLYIASDVFKDFPRLKVVICHGGGALSRHFDSDIRDGHPARREIQERFKDNLFFDTCIYDAAFMRTMVAHKGVDAAVFGTEIGAALRTDVVDLVDKVPELTTEDKIKIFNTNPLRVYSRLDA